MWFEVEGNIDVSLTFDSRVGGINTQKFCTQLVTNQVKIVNFKTSSEIEKWKNYYTDMHPKQYLTEDVLPAAIPDEAIRGTFKIFFKPLSADCCGVTIIDPYIFAKGTNVNLLFDILSSNVGSKSIRFITNLKNVDSSTKCLLETDLKKDGFVIDVINRSDIHDRLWYTRMKGFFCGTSFNGISRKTTMLNLIPDKDLSDIIKLFGI